MATETKVFACPHCPESFKSQGWLTRHLNDKHPELQLLEQQGIEVKPVSTADDWLERIEAIFAGLQGLVVQANKEDKRRKEAIKDAAEKARVAKEKGLRIYEWYIRCQEYIKSLQESGESWLASTKDDYLPAIRKIDQLIKEAILLEEFKIGKQAWEEKQAIKKDKEAALKPEADATYKSAELIRDNWLSDQKLRISMARSGALRIFRGEGKEPWTIWRDLICSASSCKAKAKRNKEQITNLDLQDAMIAQLKYWGIDAVKEIGYKIVRDGKLVGAVMHERNPHARELVKDAMQEFVNCNIAYREDGLDYDQYVEERISLVTAKEVFPPVGSYRGKKHKVEESDLNAVGEGSPLSAEDMAKLESLKALVSQ